MVENFDLLSVVHVHFVHSLLNGRAIYDEKRATFNQLPRYVVFVEASLPPTYSTSRDTEDDEECTVKEVGLEIPTMLSHQLVPLFLQKADNDDLSVINGIVESISSDFNSETRQVFSSAVNFLCNWHGLMRKKVITMLYNILEMYI